MAGIPKEPHYPTWTIEETILSHGSSSSTKTESSSGSLSSGEMKEPKDTQGYDMEFVPSADKKYECPICLLVLKDPVQTICGHRYCKQCIAKWLRDKTDVLCPACNTLIAANQTFPDNCAKREIMSLKVKCPNKNCTTVVELREMKHHSEQCRYTLIPCPNGCLEHLLRQNINSHLANDCSRRKVTCCYCRAEVYKEAIKDHETQCPEMNAQCPFCELEIPRKEHREHVSASCPQAPVTCFYAQVGCREQVIRSDLSNHYTSEVHHHLQLVTRHVLSLTSTNILYDIRDTRVHNEAPSHHRDPMQQSYDSHGSTTTSGFYSTSNVAQPSTTPFRQPPIATHTIGGRDWPYPSPEFLNQGKISSTQECRGLDTLDSCPLSDPMDSRTQLKTLTDRILHGPQRGQRNMGTGDGRDLVIARLQEEVTALNNKLNTQAFKVTRCESTIKDLSSTISDYEGRSCNGSYLWKIKNYSQRRQDAINGESTVIHSPGFYSSFYGYKLCMRVNLNGVESGQGTHISLFVHFMRGEYDDVVEWPFEGKITISILDQNENPKLRRHIVENLFSKPNLAAFQRPSSNRNHKGFGYLEYAPIAQLEQNHFIKNETLIIKAEIHTGARLP